MSYLVKISEEKAYPDIIKQYAGDDVPNQPTYPTLDFMNELVPLDSLEELLSIISPCFWTLLPHIHSTIKGSYTIDFLRPYWLIDFDDPKSAMMFKLMWGGS